jgi:cholesterol transport system auxiliary component
MSFPLRFQHALPAALALGLLAPGCVSLLPKTKPVQLYRLSEAAPAPAAPAPPGLIIAKAPTAFPPDAAGDQLLTVTGQQAAFISDARWLEPATVMFDEAVTEAFDQPGSPRLAGRGENVAVCCTLKLDVRRFETDYDRGPGAAPTVTVTIHTVLIRNSDRSVAAEKLFEVRQPAVDNRVSAIVAAFNTAVAQAVAGVRDWTALNASAVRP